MFVHPFFLAALIHLTASFLWLLGFLIGTCGMLGEKELIAVARIFWILQNLLMLLAYVWTALSLPGAIYFPLTRPADTTILTGIWNGILSPYTSFPSVIWSITLAYLVLHLRTRRASRGNFKSA